MGIDQFLTSAEKLETLNRLKSALSTEVYSLCIKAGIDPDTFEYSSYKAPEMVIPTMELVQLNLLELTCAKLSVVVDKIFGIENA